MHNDREDKTAQFAQAENVRGLWRWLRWLGGNLRPDADLGRQVVGADGFIEWGDPVASLVLCCSSAAFLGSTMLIYTLELWDSAPAVLLSVVALTTFCLSVNYWRKAVKGFRRDIDIVMARVSFLTHCAVATLYQRDVCASLIAWSLGVASYGLFVLAGKMYALRTRAWVATHAAFHCCVGLNMMMCIMAMERPDLDKAAVSRTYFAFLEHLTDALAWVLQRPLGA